MKPADGLVESYRRLVPIFRNILAEIEQEIRPGTTTKDLEQVAEAAITRFGVSSSFKGYNRYPAHITASVNHEVLNTPPSSRTLVDGDLLKLQVGLTDGRAFAYQAWTYFIGTSDPHDRTFVACGQKALQRAVEQTRTGRRVSVISRSIQETLEEEGYSPNYQFLGHGMGIEQHEPPPIPCSVMPGTPDPLLEEGKILSIQVIAHRGSHECRVLKDGWNLVTQDKSRALLMSQIVVIRSNGVEVLLEPRRSTLEGAHP